MRKADFPNIIESQINIQDIKAGMIIQHNGLLITAGRNDVKKSDFGYSFKGDSSKKTLTRVQIKVKTLLGFRIEG